MKKGNFVGEGSEKRVYEDPLNQANEYLKKRGDRVIAEIHDKENESLNSLKARYYMAKVLNLLLPGFYSKLDLVAMESADDPEDPGYFTRMEKLERDEVHKILGRRAEFLRLNINPPEDLDATASLLAFSVYQEPQYKEFVEKSEQFGLPIDPVADNFSIQSDGSLKCLDLPHCWTKQKNEQGEPYLGILFDEQKILQAIQTLPVEQRQKCSNYFNRFLGFYNAEKKIVENTK